MEKLVFFLAKSIVHMGFPAQSAVKNLPAMQELHKTWVPTLGWEDPLEEDTAATPVFLPGESHGQRSLTDYSLVGSQRVVYD